MEITETPAIIVESIAINAPIAKVFAALTEPEQLVQWWGTAGAYQVTTMEADLRPGGAWKTSGTGRNGPFSVSGTYRAVDPPNMVEFTWCHDFGEHQDPHDTIVRYDLVERNGVTELTVTHSGFTSQTDRDDHANGWPTVLGWVRDFASK